MLSMQYLKKRHRADFISAFVAFRKEISFSISERASCSHKRSPLSLLASRRIFAIAI